MVESCSKSSHNISLLTTSSLQVMPITEPPAKRIGRPPKVRDPVPTMAQILPSVSSTLHSKDSVSVS